MLQYGFTALKAARQLGHNAEVVNALLAAGAKI